MLQLPWKHLETTCSVAVVSFSASSGLPSTSLRSCEHEHQLEHQPARFDSIQKDTAQVAAGGANPSPKNQQMCKSV